MNNETRPSVQTRSVRLALGQFAPPTRSIPQGQARVTALMHEAVEAGAEWLVLPELFLGGYQLTETDALSLTADGPEIGLLVRLVNDLGVGLQVGFVERYGHSVYDSVACIAPSRDAVFYRKTHLFAKESTAFDRGAELIVFDTAGLRYAPLICYDLEFPEPARILASRGAQVLLVSTANMEPYAEQQVLFARTRALENHAFVAVANRVGRESGFQFCGSSLVADPMGRVIAQARTEETLLLADCDLALLTESMKDADYLADRRPQLYRAITE